jgi:hypothetical protein
MQITVTAPDSEVMGLNPTRGMNVCLRFFVLSCAGRDLETGRSHGLRPRSLTKCLKIIVLSVESTGVI